MINKFDERFRLTCKEVKMTVEKLNTLFETPAHARISSQQYIDDPRSEQKSDLIEGVFVMASPASYRHEELVTFLIGILTTFVTAKELGEVLGSNAAFELSEDNVYQPDISFILTKRLHLARDVYFPGPPDIAVEIISPSSRNYDTVEKKINYARYGVQEYRLIDPIHEQATFYTRASDQFSPTCDRRGHSAFSIAGRLLVAPRLAFPACGNGPAIATRYRRTTRSTRMNHQPKNRQ